MNEPGKVLTGLSCTVVVLMCAALVRFNAAIEQRALHIGSWLSPVDVLEGAIVMAVVSINSETRGLRVSHDFVCHVPAQMYGVEALFSSE